MFGKLGLIVECPVESGDHISCQRAGFKCSNDCHLATELARGMVEPMILARDALSSIAYPR